MTGGTSVCRHYRTGERLVVETVGVDRRLRAAAAGETDDGLLLGPALADLQINGYQGINFTSDEITPEGILTVTRTLRERGTPFFCPTIVTSSRETMLHALRTYEAAGDLYPEVKRANLGYHLEGPYISTEDGPRGAHPKEHARHPNWEEFQLFQEAARGQVCYVTLAPELPGAIPFIEQLAAAGILVALGHTGPNTQQITEAAAAGARLCTHLGNGAHAMLPRHPNYLWDMLAEDRLSISIIADGFHLPPQVVKVMTRAKSPAHTLLVSDVIHFGGMAPGVYPMDDNRQVEVGANGRIGLYGTPFLAGANALLDACVSNAVAFAQLDPADALDMATLHAWSLLQRPAPCLAPGQPLERAMLYRWEDGRLRVVEVID